MQNGYVPKDLNLPRAGQFSPASRGHPPHDAGFFGAWTWEGGTQFPQFLYYTG